MGLCVRWGLLVWWVVNSRRDSSLKPLMFSADGLWPTLDEVLKPYSVLVAGGDAADRPPLAVAVRRRAGRGSEVPHPAGEGERHAQEAVGRGGTGEGDALTADPVP